MNTFLMRAIPIVLLGLSLALVGCGSSSKQASEGEGTESYEEGASDEGLQLEINGDSDSNKAGILRTVHFDYDSSQLTESARSTLEENASFLQENSTIEIQVEGHCDERGGVEHNLALGERRAQAVKDYLQSMGIDSSRLSTVSYGKERPIAFGHNEETWGQNRRANFVVLSK